MGHSLVGGGQIGPRDALIGAVCPVGKPDLLQIRVPHDGRLEIVLKPRPQIPPDQRLAQIEDDIQRTPDPPQGVANPGTCGR